LFVLMVMGHRFFSTPLRKSQWGHAFQLMAPDGCDGTEFSSSFVFTHSPSFFVV
jgi:hypothetical protein